MSGLCGWFSGAEVEPDCALRRLRRMARSLRQFDASPLQTQCLPVAAAAIAAHPGGAQLYRAHGVLVAIWGQARMAGAGAGVAAALAARWQAVGRDACAELSGAFALCILDSGRAEALLACDRSGSHSLIYQLSQDGLLFGSRTDALLAHPGAGGREADPQSLYNYLYFHMVPAPATIYGGQQRLLPGQYLHYRQGRAVCGQYWTLRFQEQRPATFAQRKNAFVLTLEQAVAEAADGHRVGCFLSGGTDSSTIAGMLARVGAAPVQSYSIGFEAPGYDEMSYARLASRHFGTVHHELYLTADDVVDAIPRIAAVFDQPFGNASAVPAYFCARMARDDGVTRMLAGDGGDELFGGNERYAHQAVLSRYERLPSALRQLLIEPLLFKLAGGAQLALLRKARSYIEQATMALPGRLENYNLLRRYGPATVLEPELLARVNEDVPPGLLCQQWWQYDGLSQINQMLALDMRFTLADNDLPKVNRACELAGIEVAYPFLNDAMVAFASRLAPRDKLRGSQLRYFFKQALADFLPPAILRKQKHGFGLPFGYWLQGHRGLQELAYDSLHDLKSRHIVRADFIDTLLEHHLQEHPAYHGTMVWLLMMLEQWLARRSMPVHGLAHGEAEAFQPAAGSA